MEAEKVSDECENWLNLFLPNPRKAYSIAYRTLVHRFNFSMAYRQYKGHRGHKGGKGGMEISIDTSQSQHAKSYCKYVSHGFIRFLSFLDTSSRVNVLPVQHVGIRMMSSG